LTPTIIASNNSGVDVELGVGVGVGVGVPVLVGVIVGVTDGVTDGVIVGVTLGVGVGDAGIESIVGSAGLLFIEKVFGKTF
jgi:hypothetical protein